MRRLLPILLLLASAGCALLPDPADLESVLPPPEAYESGIVIQEFAP